MDKIIKALQSESEKILAHYREELTAIRTSRATPALVENIMAEAYGSVLPLKQLAAFSVNQPNVIVVQPWDKTMLQAIEKAIRDAKIGLSPVVEGEIIRLTLPPLTEERRKELTKILSQKTEEARIAFRLARDEARRQIQELFEAKKLTEDDKYRGHEGLQKETDKFNTALEDLSKRKETEILTV